MDGNTSQKTYPRPSDPTFNTWLTVANKTNDTFEVNVGTSPLVSFTPTDADYNPTTGLMTLTIGNHTLSAGTSIKLLPTHYNYMIKIIMQLTTHIPVLMTRSMILQSIHFNNRNYYNNPSIRKRSIYQHNCSYICISNNRSSCIWW